MAVSMHGSVRRKDQTPVQGASVWLIGPIEVLKPQALARRAPLKVEWTRAITGFSGSRWNCWQRFVENQVAGITWPEFLRQFNERHPDIGEDKGLLLAEKTYALPQNPGSGQRLMNAVTAADGSFTLTDLPETGEYLLLTQAEGFRSVRKKVTLAKEETIEITLTEVPAPVVTPPVVVPAPRPDFVQVKDGKFMLKGQPLRFVGVNLRGLVHYGDQEKEVMFKASTLSDREQQTRSAREMGARVVRFFLANRFRSTQEVGDRLSATLEILRQRDMYAIVALIDTHNDTFAQVPGDKEEFYDGPHGMPNRRFFESASKNQGRYLDFVKAIVTRFKDHERIFAWELGNELRAQEKQGPATLMLPDVTIAFAHHVASVIRGIDPLHLIGTGFINSGNTGMDGNQARVLYSNANLNFLTIHVYPDKGQGDPEVLRAPGEASLARSLGKPFIIEEIGYEKGDRADKLTKDMAVWFDQEKASGLLYWAYADTDRNNGDLDELHGMDRFYSRHKGDFKALSAALSARARNL